MSDRGWVLVTGYSGGIGSEVTRSLLRAGYSVYGIDRSGRAKAASFTTEDTLRSTTFDLTQLQDISSLIQSVSREVGPLRGFVHCAGVDLLRPLYMTRPDDFEQLMRVHAVAPLLIMGELTKANRVTDGFSGVLLSSLAIHEGAKGHVAYAAAKGAVSGSLKALASELVKKGARVNVVSPGIVETELSDAWLSRLDTHKLEELKSLYPLGFGLPKDIAALTCFLISQDSRWITGQEFIVDGGRLVS